MPQERNSKSLFLEALFVVGLLTIIGHVGVNCWEKYFIHSELSLIKNNLQSLQDTLLNIGNAYDYLQNQLNSVIENVKADPRKLQTITAYVAHDNSKFKSTYTLGRRRLHDLELKSIIDARNDILDEPYKPNSFKQDSPIDKIKGILRSKDALPKFVKDATTITKNPLKSTAAGQDSPKKHYTFNSDIYNKCDCTKDPCNQYN